MASFEKIVHHSAVFEKIFFRKQQNASQNKWPGRRNRRGPGLCSDRFSFCNPNAIHCKYKKISIFYLSRKRQSGKGMRKIVKQPKAEPFRGKLFAFAHRLYSSAASFELNSVCAPALPSPFPAGHAHLCIFLTAAAASPTENQTGSPFLFQNRFFPHPPWPSPDIRPEPFRLC